MLKKPVIWITLTGLIFGGLFFEGCSRGHHYSSPEKRAKWIISKLESELDLTSQQLTKVNQIKDKILTRRKELRSKNKNLFKEFIAQIKQDKVDVEEVNKLIGQKEKQFRKNKKFYVDKFVEFHEILTSKQREKLVNKLQKFHDKFKH
ncbi:MAG: Spy/CpxP family protein refolding chaperone [Spirochaetota bacterium]|nr:Spy/CpxP family protein refolding chaperone [Spirochaetota bacterium]